MWIKIDWLPMKSADQDPHCFPSIQYNHVTTEITSCFCPHLLTFFRTNFFKNYFRNTISAKVISRRQVTASKERDKVNSTCVRGRQKNLAFRITGCHCNASLMMWVQTFCTGYQHTTKITASKENIKVNSFV